MNFNNPGINPALSDSSAEGYAPHRAAETVDYQGEVFVLEKPAEAVMTDALEELSFGAAERAMEHLKERKFETSHQAKAVLQIEKYFEYVDALVDLKKEKYLKDQNPSDLKSLLNQPEIKRDDVTQRFLGLLSLLGKVRQENAKLRSNNEANLILERELTEELTKLEADCGREIRSGINIAKTANLFANKEMSQQNLRFFYKETILDYSNALEAYVETTKRFGFEQFDKGLSFLLKALGADMGAALPSMPKPQLARIINDMTILKIMASMRERCVLTVRRLRERRRLSQKTEREHDENEQRDGMGA